MLVGAQLAAQALVTREPHRSYSDTLDEVLRRLTDGVPLAAEPLVTRGSRTTSEASGLLQMRVPP